ncbi:MAG: hypothetical protein ACREVM_06360, partial [Burkholderiales bacterium]
CHGVSGASLGSVFSGGMDVLVLWRVVVKFTAAWPAAATRGEPREANRKKWRRLENDGRIGMWLANCPAIPYPLLKGTGSDWCPICFGDPVISAKHSRIGAMFSWTHVSLTRSLSS